MSVCDSSLIFGLQLVVDSNVQVSSILLVWSASKLACDVFASLDSEDIGEIEDGLLPMCVFGVWTGAEAHGLVASGEFDVKPGNDRMHIVCSPHREVIRKLEVEVVGCAGVEVEGQDRAWICDDGLEFDSVDKWLGEGGKLKRRVVESINIIPDCEVA